MSLGRTARIERGASRSAGPWLVSSLVRGLVNPTPGVTPWASPWVYPGGRPTCYFGGVPSKSGSGSDASPKTKSKGRPIEISPVVFVFLKKLAEMRVYGDQPGAVASLIIRKEIMHLLETGVLKEAELLKAIRSDAVKPEGEDLGALES
jgi:hypothetical protein